MADGCLILHGEDYGSACLQAIMQQTTDHTDPCKAESRMTDCCYAFEVPEISLEAEEATAYGATSYVCPRTTRFDSLQ